ncbi:MAG TPA: L-threonylcarbamoyladenylate synthase, partial [Bacteroidales bacterium]|nr:L-threonylcarbamoyladenylate synthase [Bacteroidales bacterium]
MDAEITKCAELLKEGKVILYPTDTIWGLGCDATNSKAVDKIYKIKERQEIKSLIILIDSESRLPLYVEDIPLIAWDLITHTYRPTTFVYPKAKNLPSRLIPMDQSIAIRIVKNKFCQKLIQLLDKPIISTSANLSGEPSPDRFAEVEIIGLSKTDSTI